MIHLLQSFILADNLTLEPQALVGLRTSLNLQSVVISNLQATNGFRLENLCLENCKELASITLAGTLGINILPTPSKLPIPQKSVPLNWKGLTKVSSISFGNCSFNSEEVDELIIGLSEVINLGFGSSVLTVKTILLNGANAKPTLTNTKVVEAKALILAKGWTITHN